MLATRPPKPLSYIIPMMLNYDSSVRNVGEWKRLRNDFEEAVVVRMVKIKTRFILKAEMGLRLLECIYCNRVIRLLIFRKTCCPLIQD